MINNGKADKALPYIGAANSTMRDQESEKRRGIRSSESIDSSEDANEQVAKVKDALKPLLQNKM